MIIMISKEQEGSNRLIRKTDTISLCQYNCLSNDECRFISIYHIKYKISCIYNI